MWRIRALILAYLLFAWTQGNAHPVSVMTGDAVWAGNQLILTMRIPADQLLLHCQVQADDEGYIYLHQIEECGLTFLEIVRHNFLLNIPANISPVVKRLPGEKIPAKTLLTDLHDYDYAFEIRFICDRSPETIVLKQTMGNYHRGLQSTALITFHLGGIAELIPLYNDLTVTVDLIHNKIIDGKINPVLSIDEKEVTLFLPADWVAHGLPFDILFDDGPADGVLIGEKNEMANLIGYRFTMPEAAGVLTVTLVNMVWQLGKVEMIVKKSGAEDVLVFSRFVPKHQINLK